METQMDLARVRKELATFRPPAKVETREAPDVGDPARPLPVPVGHGRPAVVMFLRHTGCPYAEATVIAVRKAAVLRPDVDFVAVSHTSEQSTSTWCTAVGGAEGVRVLTDESRTSYAAWGVAARFSLDKENRFHMFSTGALGTAKRLQTEGIINRDPSGTRWQRAGTFAVDASGTVRWRHLPAHAGEIPDIDAALRAVSDVSTPAS